LKVEFVVDMKAAVMAAMKAVSMDILEAEYLVVYWVAMKVEKKDEKGVGNLVELKV
jgi:hypothetical protein